ncbi:glycine/betaine ABC transporter substrate-binding protein [Aerococcus sanguinicola]|uniref:Glycine/betaine ABC transporter substrate-binding protein n=1 Tax=Aerococcus sanguinicola TaxID=119206 RepID=A0A2I1MKQ9_9LACT|nr:glycine/betaine ABC transporter substrate-binding protein [Aerococcus sp. HMSC23C02]PKZ20714.1 glycine/betaine ABC transporter substrate-binding protein [Aerococcus sanguinicola]
MKKIILGIVAVLGLVLSLGSPGAFRSSLFSGGGSSNGESITLSYVEWDTEVASTNVIAEVLRREGYDVTITPLDNAIMWSAVATGEADGMVGAWLPQTHGPQFDQYGDQMEDLGPNLEGAKIGMVVPEYMDVNSIEDLSSEADSVITGIEPGAGVVAATEDAVAQYPNLSDWTVETSSSGAMTTALGQAISNEEEIVVTGWSPHWKFQAYDLKYLEDPKGVYGGEETINTMVRQGFKGDHPRAYQILDQFNWSLDDMESVMLEISNGKDPQQAAIEWIDANPDKVEEWLAE